MRLWYRTQRAGKFIEAAIYIKKGDLCFVVRRIRDRDRRVVEHRAEQTIKAYRAVEKLPWCACGKRHALDNYCGGTV